MLENFYKSYPQFKNLNREFKTQKISEIGSVFRKLYFMMSNREKDFKYIKSLFGCLLKDYDIKEYYKYKNSYYNEYSLPECYKLIINYIKEQAKIEKNKKEDK